MKREILFKAKRFFKSTEKKDNNRWVYGNLVFFANQYCIQKKTKQNNFTDVKNIYIFQETICQYTGEIDSFGNKLFEGDIVETEYKYTYYLKYENGAYVFYHTNLKEWDGSELKWGGVWRIKELNILFKVIGNINDKKQPL